MNETSLNELTCEHFSAVAGTTFQVSASAEASIPLQLVEVRRRARPAEARSPQGESFSLFFTGPRTHLLPQRLYWFVHDTLGRFELFIVPVSQDASTFGYEAVFNRLSTAPGKRTDASPE